MLREGRRIHAGIDGTALDNPQYQAVEGMQKKKEKKKKNEAEERTSLLAAEGHEALLRVARSQLTRVRPPPSPHLHRSLHDQSLPPATFRTRSLRTRHSSSPLVTCIQLISIVIVARRGAADQTLLFYESAPYWALSHDIVFFSLATRWSRLPEQRLLSNQACGNPCGHIW